MKHSPSSKTAPDDFVQRYMEDSCTHPLLKPEEEVAMAKKIEHTHEKFLKAELADPEGKHEAYIRAKNAYDDARNKLVRANCRLVVSIARKFLGRGVELLDLIQEGNDGLITAATPGYFDYRQGFRFTTYASWWVRQRMQNAVAVSHTVQIPRHLLDKASKVERARHALRGLLSREPTVEELASATSLEPYMVERSLEASLRKTALSIDEQDADEYPGLLQALSSEQSANPTEEIETAECKAKIHALLLKCLPDDRQRQIIKLRFGIDCETPLKLHEIGEILNITKERVRQIELEAMTRLKNGTEKEELREHIDA